MPEIILHHYAISPYAEKIRLVLGFKQLSWRSVDIPVIMPKPDLMPLTGGFRRTPVLQIGADIYCDTERIAQELERRHPTPTLFPGHARGLAAMIGAWADAYLFLPAVGVGRAANADKLPMEFLKDRAAMRGQVPDLERFKANGPRHRERVRTLLEWLEELLGDGRAYLLGEAGLADFSAFHSAWMLRRGGPAVAAVLEPFPKVRAWMERIDRIGHGQSQPMDAKEALRIAKQARPEAPVQADPANALGLKPGDRITVTAEDINRDPVAGELVALSANAVAVRRQDDQVGEVVVHFPRVGYDIQRA